MKQKIVNEIQIKMAVRSAEITKIFRNIQETALIALIVVNQVILRAIVSNCRINPTVTVVQVTITVKDRIFNSKDVAFTTIAMKNNFSSDILDSGASCHYCQSAEGLTDIKEIDESIKIGNDDPIKLTKIGNLKCEVTQINVENLTIKLNDV
jgi:hypothetical protein